MLPFREVFDEVSRLVRKIPMEESLHSGRFPILAQGKEPAAGFTNETEGLFTDLPALAFGDHTRSVKYVETPCFLANDGVKLLKLKLPHANLRCLYHLLRTLPIPDAGYRRHFRLLREMELPIPPLELQNQIAEVLDQIDRLIFLRENQLEKLAQLLKSRFLEHFGHPADPNSPFPFTPLADFCEIIDGDRNRNYPARRELARNGFCLFLNGKNVTKNGFSFEHCHFLTREKDESLCQGKLKRGDLVLTTRGTIGNLAFYSPEIPFEHIRINSGMAILRPNPSRLDPFFFMELFHFQLPSIRTRSVTGTAQPQLPISTLRQMRFPLPPIALQRTYGNFAFQVRKTHTAVSRSLHELERLREERRQTFFR